MKSALWSIFTGLWTTAAFVIAYRSRSRDEGLEYRQDPRLYWRGEPPDYETIVKRNLLGIKVGIALGVLITSIGLIALVMELVG